VSGSESGSSEAPHVSAPAATAVQKTVGDEVEVSESSSEETSDDDGSDTASSDDDDDDRNNPAHLVNSKVTTELSTTCLVVRLSGQCVLLVFVIFCHLKD